MSDERCKSCKEWKEYTNFEKDVFSDGYRLELKDGNCNLGVSESVVGLGTNKDFGCILWKDRKERP